MGIRELAAKARQKLRGDTSASDDAGVDRMVRRFDNTADERYGAHNDRMRESANERIDDFTATDETYRHNREAGGR